MKFKNNMLFAKKLRPINSFSDNIGRFLHSKSNIGFYSCLYINYFALTSILKKEMKKNGKELSGIYL